MNKILILLLIQFSVFASDSLNIEAQNALINKKTNVTHYTGNVSITHRALKVKANDVKIKKIGESDYKIIALGTKKKLASYNNKDSSNIFAKANKIIYSTKKEFIQLIGKAYFNQNGNEFKGEKINYNQKKRSSFDAG